MYCLTTSASGREISIRPNGNNTRRKTSTAWDCSVPSNSNIPRATPRDGRTCWTSTSTPASTSCWTASWSLTSSQRATTSSDREHPLPCPNAMRSAGAKRFPSSSTGHTSGRQAPRWKATVRSSTPTVMASPHQWTTRGSSSRSTNPGGRPLNARHSSKSTWRSSTAQATTKCSPSAGQLPTPSRPRPPHNIRSPRCGSPSTSSKARPRSSTPYATPTRHSTSVCKTSLSRP